MFIHHVFFWLKNPANSEESRQLREGIVSLTSIKPHVYSHIGVPAPTDRSVIDSTYNFSLLIAFDTSQDEESYQSHPVHDAFRNTCGHLWSKVIVYDSVDC